LTALFSETGGCLFGLPRRDFDRALLWRRTTSNTAETEIAESGWKGKAPTWSWVAPRQHFAYSDEDKPFEIGGEVWCGSLLLWIESYTFGDEWGFRAIRADGECWSWSPGFHDTSPARSYMAYACRREFFNLISSFQFPAGIPVELDGLEGDAEIEYLDDEDSDEEANDDEFSDDYVDTIHDVYHSSLTRRWPHYEIFWGEAFASRLEEDGSLPPKISNELSQRYGDLPNKERLIFTEAIVAYFRIKRRDSTPAIMDIIDDKDNFVGAIIEGEVVPSLLVPKRSGIQCEFIALSLSALPSWGLAAKGLVPELSEENDIIDKHGLQYPDRDGVLQNDDTPIVNVMLIGWQDRCARRISVGRIFLSEWTKAEYHLKWIALG